MDKKKEGFRFQELKIWQNSIEVTDRLFDIADSLTEKRFYQFAEQLRGASLSIPNNIAEGSGRSSKADFRRFIDFAKGSIYEVANMVIIFTRRSYLKESSCDEMLSKLQELAKMISGFRATL